jgi:tRNA(Ile)-lysidine synthase
VRTESIDADTVTLPLLVRSRKPGDRFHQLGAPGHAKLKEFLRARGVPEHLRDTWPVVCTGAEIVWVPALRIGHAARRTTSTRRCLALEVTHVPPDVNSFLASRAR